jgi:hypothetical protein
LLGLGRANSKENPAVVSDILALSLLQYLSNFITIEVNPPAAAKLLLNGVAIRCCHHPIEDVMMS